MLVGDCRDMSKGYRDPKQNTLVLEGPIGKIVKNALTRNKYQSLYKGYPIYTIIIYIPILNI
jgi:hypothetical protein